jgi:hypothetical protein
MNTDPRTPPEALAEFNRFYSTTHVGEVIAAHPGFVSANRFELIDTGTAEARLRAPQWLAVYGMADEAAVLQYLEDNERPWLHRRKYSPWPPARRRAKTVWRMIWRRSATTGSLSKSRDALLMLGMNVAPRLTVLPGYARATCLELHRAFEPAESSLPRFCVIHETDRDLAQADSPGRASDEADGLWRLLYRRIPPPE